MTEVESTVVDVGPVGEFAIGELQKVEIPGKDIYVLRRSPDTFVGLKNTCPHHSGPLCLGRVDGTYLPSAPGQFEFGLEFGVIRCPWHAYEYDLETGRALFVPEVKDRIVRYDVSVRDGRVLVDLRGRR